MSFCEKCHSLEAQGPGEQEEKRSLQAEDCKGRTLSDLHLKPLTNSEVITILPRVSLCSPGWLWPWDSPVSASRDGEGLGFWFCSSGPERERVDSRRGAGGSDETRASSRRKLQLNTKKHGTSSTAACLTQLLSVIRACCPQASLWVLNTSWDASECPPCWPLVAQGTHKKTSQFFITKWAFIST